MNTDYMPHEWLDDAMPEKELNPLFPNEPVLDANSIEDFDFDEKPVIDYKARNIGYMAVPKRKKNK